MQLTIDGHRAYLEVVESAFGADTDSAMLVKLYGAPQKSDTRYRSFGGIGVQSQRIQGNPEFVHISTSYAERQHLPMRMAMRRLTRLTNDFSKKVENPQHVTSLYFMYDNIARIHSTLRVTTAKDHMAATVDARAQAAAGEGLTVGRRVHTVRYGQGNTA